MNVILKFFVNLSPIWQALAILVSVSLNINIPTELFFITFTSVLYFQEKLLLFLESSWTVFAIEQRVKLLNIVNIM